MNNYQYHKSLFLLVYLFLFCISSFHAQVKIYEKEEIIPTYKIGKPETSPIFYSGRSVQGAEGRIYPYPSQTKLSDSLVDVTYNMVVLENEYLIVKVLPTFGGRLFSAIDKTNGHELFHTNSVIKPDLIGTLGAWVSGGIEWCFPHHHRTTTMLPSDYRLVKNDDGSATIWIGETEKTMRMRGVIGMTLRPGRSFIETDYRINNTSTLTKTFLFWANVAVTANKDFRTFWPPSQNIGVFHNNSSFIQWPISNKTNHYGRTNYEEGIDLTWWKNHPDPVSFFMWNASEGFIGGYDYKQKAGMIHVGDPHKNSTSKLWQFGPGLGGQNARRKLTDDGKAYVELMTGTFSNNQPDYSWIVPHSVKDAKNYWFPIRDIEVVKNSNTDAAVTLQMRNSKTVFYGFNTTKALNNAEFILKEGDEILVQDKINIDPANPFSALFKSKEAINEYKLHIQLLDEHGNSIISYTPNKTITQELPRPQEKVKKPEDINSVEDLYLAGRFIEQFKRPRKNADEYYLAALKKSPTDYRVNLALGKRRIGQGKHKEGLDYLKTASDKLKTNYFQPKEGELFYYLGVAQKALGHTKEAYKNFARSTWYYEWFSSGNFQLALLESAQNNNKKALEYIEKAYSTNNLDGKIVVLYSALLRKEKQKEKALEIINKLIDYDPINYSALHEYYLIQENGSLSDFQKNMQDIENNYLEVATNYLNASLYSDAINVLNEINKPNNPLTFYYLSYLYSKQEKPTATNKMLTLAQNTALEYCFPYREESEIILNHAISLDNKNAHAYYLLGNLLYDDRPKEAIAAWTKARDINSNIPMVLRNLAFGSFYYEKSYNEAVEYMIKAIEQDNSNSLWYAELSKYFDASNFNFNKCLNILENNLEMVQTDIKAPKMYVELLNLNGDYDKSLTFLKSHHFRTWEGRREIYWYYVNSNVLKAMELINQDKYDNAITYLNQALEYPENLEVGKSSSDDKNALIHFYLGKAFNKLGKTNKAKDHFQKSINSNIGYRMNDLIYFQAESLKKMNKTEEANAKFNQLINLGKNILDKYDDNELIAVEESYTNESKIISKGYYLQALGQKGLGNIQKSKMLFQEALKTYKNNLWANVMMNNSME
ncbi:DUF5107 domain-containing protein [uncultured Algibacter sp.]|uniref:DUF5107 domain-containing protein n=1 Tax=uncultured Algibacter sp. TaxID=298659 RepID=UPI002633073C|nr:DUF5107 domain-containing protein [uncultured Algibacter sp.]